MNEPISHKLYKYQSLDLYSHRNLVKQELFFSKPENFNDPYDCDPPFRIGNTDRTEKNLKALFDKIKNSLSDASDFEAKYLTNGKTNRQFEKEYLNRNQPIRDLIQAKVGVTCFSECKENILLWSLYADKHKGFCLEFDTRVPIIEGWQNTKLYKVKYPSSKKSYHVIKILDMINDPDVLEGLLTTKSYQWYYENEWRIFCKNGGDRTYRFNSKALTGVYFGYRMPQEDRDVISSIIACYFRKDVVSDLSTAAKNFTKVFKIGSNVTLFEMKLSRETFKISPIPYRPNYKKE